MDSDVQVGVPLVKDRLWFFSGGEVYRNATGRPASVMCPRHPASHLNFFRVSDLRAPAPDSPHEPDEDEDIETHIVTVAEARAMVERGDIVDLKTAYAPTPV